VKLEGSRLSEEKVPLEPGTLSGSSHGGGPPRPPVGVRPPTTSFGQLRWALRPGAQEPSARPAAESRVREGDQVLPGRLPPSPKVVFAI